MTIPMAVLRMAELEIGEEVSLLIEDDKSLSRCGNRISIFNRADRGNAPHAIEALRRQMSGYLDRTSRRGSLDQPPMYRPPKAERRVNFSNASAD